MKTITVLPVTNLLKFHFTAALKTWLPNFSLLMACIFFCTQARSAENSQSTGEKLDLALFTAYNSCDLVAFGNMLAKDVEFYHDKGGPMLGREAVVTAVKNNICGKVRREIVAGTLLSYPMDNYGLVQQGEHRFCTTEDNKCVGVARFTHLWQEVNGVWQVTHIISFDHQAL